MSPKATTSTLETQILLMGKDMSQLQKDVSMISTDMRGLKDKQFVTTNEMTLAIQNAVTTQANTYQSTLTSVEKKVDDLSATHAWIVRGVGLIIIGAIMNLVFTYYKP